MPQGYKHFSKTKPMLYEHFAPVRAWWNNRRESDVSQYVPVEDIVAVEYNLDFCGFPHETEEILPPDEFIAQYRNEKAILTERIESILAKIQTALAQEDVL